MMLYFKPPQNDSCNQSDKKTQIHYNLLRIQALLSIYTDAICSWNFPQQADVIPDKLIGMMESLDDQISDLIHIINL